MLIGLHLFEQRKATAILGNQRQLEYLNGLTRLVVKRPLLWQTPYLFGDIEVEDHHAEVVDYEGLPKDEWLPVLHVSRSRPQEEQVQAADGQRREGRWHHGPFFDPFVCGERGGLQCVNIKMGPVWRKGYEESLLFFYRL